MKYILYTCAVVFLLIVASACEHTQKIAQPSGPASFDDIFVNIISQRCGITGCHVTGVQSPEMDSKQKAYNNLVGVASLQMTALNRVEPSDPNSSYLYLKIIADNSGRTGNRMPAGGNTFLNGSQIELIRSWIADGAANN